MPIITRFAPSPTGSLHIGGARTALSIIYAKSNNGIFKLRIEDTDKSRNTQYSIDSIKNGLNWLGLEIDKKVIFQSENKEKHIKVANKMISENLAYKCFHTEEELIEIRIKKKSLKVMERQKSRYN